MAENTGGNAVIEDKSLKNQGLGATIITKDDSKKMGNRSDSLKTMQKQKEDARVGRMREAWEERRHAEQLTFVKTNAGIFLEIVDVPREVYSEGKSLQLERFLKKYCTSIYSVQQCIDEFIKEKLN